MFVDLHATPPTIPRSVVVAYRTQVSDTWLEHGEFRTMVEGKGGGGVKKEKRGENMPRKLG